VPDASGVPANRIERLNAGRDGRRSVRVNQGVRSYLRGTAAGVTDVAVVERHGGRQAWAES